MDRDDHGHRYGNFPNYYSFHPPQNRLDVLIRTGILDYITSSLCRPILSSEQPSKSTRRDDAVVTSKPLAPGGCDRSQYSRKTPRLHKDSSIDRSKHVSDEECHHNSQVVYYCDLGCNEGDLTMAMAELLSNDIAEKSQKRMQNSNILSQVCKKYAIKCLGLDIDPMLIERANSKFSVSIGSSGDTKTDYKDQNALNAWCNNLLSLFKVANLCFAAEHNYACLSFVDSNESNHKRNTKFSETGPNPCQEQEDIIPRPVFQLTTIFSTTMWIHMHAGDAGLEAFLERACGWTKNFLLVEPQPSGW